MTQNTNLVNSTMDDLAYRNISYIDFVAQNNPKTILEMILELVQYESCYDIDRDVNSLIIDLKRQFLTKAF